MKKSEQKEEKLTVGKLEDIIASLRLRNPMHYRDCIVAINNSDDFTNKFIDGITDDFRFSYDHQSIFDKGIVHNPTNMFDVPGKLILNTNKERIVNYESYITVLNKQLAEANCALETLATALTSVRDYYVRRNTVPAAPNCGETLVKLGDMVLTKDIVDVGFDVSFKKLIMDAARADAHNKMGVK